MILSKKGVEAEFLMKVVMVIMAILVLLFLLLPIISIILMIHGDNIAKQNSKRVYFDLYYSLKKLKHSSYLIPYSAIPGGYFIKCSRGTMYLYDPRLKVLEKNKCPVPFKSNWHIYLDRDCVISRCVINITYESGSYHLRPIAVS